MSRTAIGCVLGQVFLFGMADFVIGHPHFGMVATLALQGGAMIVTGVLVSKWGPR